MIAITPMYKTNISSTIFCISEEKQELTLKYIATYLFFCLSLVKPVLIDMNCSHKQGSRFIYLGNSRNLTLTSRFQYRSNI